MIDLPTKKDLSPGDARSADTDLAQFQISVVRSSDDPKFDLGYRQLWEQFGSVAEVEQRDVLERRLMWNPTRAIRGVHLQYEMIVVESDRGEFVAVRDHTAICGDDTCVVHLSHLLVAPNWRRSGITGWMRAFPIVMARRLGMKSITLAAEMDHPSPNGMARLKSYERAGFRKVDPGVVDYLQPDFRSFADIDATGVKPLHMALIVRRVGRESEETISGKEVREIVESLYTMYAIEFREKDMAIVYENLKTFPGNDVPVKLVLPTA